MSQRTRQHSKSVKLSPGEMEIMSQLWQHGAMTIAQARESLGRPIGYTTVQTRLNRLADKGLVQKSTDRPASYSAAVSANSIGGHHLDDLVDRVAGGKVVPLVAHLVQQRSLSKHELQELKAIIRDAEEKHQSQEAKS